VGLSGNQMMSDPFQTPEQIRAAYEDGLPGWQFNPDTMDALLAFGKATLFAETAPHLIEHHEKLFGKKPKVLAGDKGFCTKAEKYAELAEQVETQAIPRRMRDFADKVLAV
jgi:hypothetical protein